MEKLVMGMVGLMLVAATSACAQQETTTVATPTAEAAPASEIAVKLQEWAVVPAPKVGAAGDVTFDVDNSGKVTHEFVIVKTDLAPGDLPTVDDGSVDEEALEVVDEIEDLAAGKSEELEVELEAGTHVLLCNVLETEEEAEEHAEHGVEHGDVLAHYALGMRTSFTVR